MGGVIKKKEIWKEIPGFYGTYKISNFGNLYSSHKKGLLKTKVNGLDEYHRVSLNKKNIRHHFKIHRLVAICFIKNKLNKKTVNHIDGDKDNNKASNLEWLSYSENNKHAWDLGLRKR